MERNAIILAAGKSNRFAPFTYEKPKGLFKVKNEILIERQIEQLLKAGVKDIYVVVGYMKEKYFYLEQKYGVRLLINNDFGKYGNLYSLYIAREYLTNTYICCADHYFIDNPFMYANCDNHSYRACSYLSGKFKEFAVRFSDADVITAMEVGGENSFAMVGHAYMNDKFSEVFRTLMENEIADFGVASMFWEEFYGKHIEQLTFYIREFEANKILEFDSIDDLRAFDSEFLLNLDSEIITNICKTLHCNPNDIKDISVINAGLTNVSFAFTVATRRAGFGTSVSDSVKYVYRHPGGTAGNLIDRRSELFAQMAAKDIGIDKSVIHMDLSGWKISYFVPNAKNCDFEKNENQLVTAVDYLHRLHSIQPDCTVKVFDNVLEGKKLMSIASATKGNLQKEFAVIIEKIDRLYSLVKADAQRLGYGLVLCHNDTYEPNYLFDEAGEMYLIDWEYAGLNYAANDICCILCRYDWTEQQISKYLKAYVGRELTKDEHRYYMAFLPLCAFYWFCWGLYKGSVGDDDSFFFLPAYRNLVRFIDVALDSYEHR
ncbi:MAG: NTP transferase domain-containing protein [Eubacteriales bacterium]|nr:NTP transferase domain-containing protein [Eubacteriales bacterium]